jgi:hypothetical protein
MKVQREGVGLGEQQRGQAARPTQQQPPLVVPAGAVGGFAHEGLLGQHVGATEQAGRLVEVVLVAVAASLLIEELQGQQAQQGAGGGDHRARRGKRPARPGAARPAGPTAAGKGTGPPGASASAVPAPVPAGGHRPPGASRGVPLSRQPRAVCLGVGRRKGGRGGGLSRTTKRADQLAEGVVAVAEALGGFFLGAALDEDAAERFVRSAGRCMRVAGRSPGKDLRPWRRPREGEVIIRPREGGQNRGEDRQGWGCRPWSR